VASRRKELQEDAKFRMLQIINENPQMTTREIAQKVRISNGSAYYLLTSLIDMGFIKLSNFKESSQKVKYSYLLTPKGIREKSFVASKFLVRKKQEYELLKKEIIELERDIGWKIEAKKCTSFMITRLRVTVAHRGFAWGIAKAHAFVDGNKRTAFVTSATFLRLNGWQFVTEPAEGVAFMEGLASNEVSEEKLKNWLEHGSKEIQ
jgi:EPS-associated MarR family transcriptional regulator